MSEEIEREEIDTEQIKLEEIDTEQIEAVQIEREQIDPEKIKAKKIKSKKTAMIVGVSIVIAVAIIFSIVIVVFVTNIGKESTASIVDNVLIIDGGYSAEINIADAEVTLLDKLPVLTRKNNGYSGGGVLKGDFTMENFADSIYLNIYNDKITCIRIVSDGEHYYINRSTVEETNLLFDEIIESQTI